MAVVRIVMAIEPQMYQEVFAFHLRHQRPQSEVMLASSQTLQDEAKHVSPHLIVANEVPPEYKKKKGVFWVELCMAGRLEATISTNTHSNNINEVSLQDLLAVVDKAEEKLAYGS